ncbi:DUF5668 domain-containing protein [Reichenbachiella sp. MALMAid0571]|uniref:LiaF transmembrane domain-containing protein n=1 Tax=Reichenbachiella sp. MALMAid0571 TaxID=3143939 RepID=UPI0032DF9CEA
MREHNNSRKNVWIGVLLVTLGAYFLFRNFDLIPDFIPHFLFGWQSVFILIGATMLVTGKRSGVVFLLIGGISHLSHIFYWPHISLRDWWPLILVAIGISILMKRRHQGFSRDTVSIDEDYIDEVSIFGGSKKKVSAQNFKGGKVTSIFGGSEINFLDARLSNEENIIDVFCMFGGSSFIVPADWTIVMESFIIFGGYADKRPLVSNVTQDPGKVLRIKGFVMFGGGEVKSI